MTDPRGSIWRKWDLHIHTPASFHWSGARFANMTEEARSQSMKSMIEAINASDVAAFAIMDYWTFDGFLALRRHSELAHQPVCTKKIFPGMELRIDAPVDYRLNIHVLLADFLTNQQLVDFKSRLLISIGTAEVPLSDECLVRFAHTLDASKAAFHGFAREQLSSEENLLKLGSMTAVVSRKSLREAIDILPKGSALIVMPYDTSDGLQRLDWKQHPHADNYFMQSANIFETREEANVDLFHCRQTEKNRDFFENFKKTLGGEPKPCVSGSDAHRFADYGIFPSGKATWIKADVTFEGLKQIIYEPVYRAAIGVAPPLDPIYVIQRASFNFPDDTMLGSEDFCLRGKATVYFSPNLTCFIGGRGTGKSTILNLIHEKLNPSQNKFLKDHTLKNAVVDSCVTVDGANNIEFLSQNEIEEFATNPDKFTAAIFARLLKFDKEGLLEKCSEKLAAYLDEIDYQISRYDKRIELSARMASKSSELKTYRDIVEFLKDEEYQQLSKDLRTNSERLEQVKAASRKLASLIAALQTVLKEHTIESSVPSNEYHTFHADAINQINDIVKRYLSSVPFANVRAEEKTLSDEITNLQSQLEKYLSSKNLSKENLLDISRANQMLSTLEGEIADFQKELDFVNADIASFKLDKGTKEEYERQIVAQLQPISEQLKNLNGEVKTIGLDYAFQTENAKTRLLEMFMDKLPLDDKKSRHRQDFVESVLFLVDPEKLQDQQAFLNSISHEAKDNKTTTGVISFLTDPNNYEVYKLLAYRVFLDVEVFKTITVSYDEKLLTDSSFGQRCTAAMVILLLLGNTPLVIDEPEAHLDSALIARYLVNLLKERKQERQVIFATHNANFVVNGDSELINVLSMDANKITQIEPTTLENLEQRHTIVALEGGKEAFKQREMKYEFPE